MNGKWLICLIIFTGLAIMATAQPDMQPDSVVQAGTGEHSLDTTAASINEPQLPDTVRTDTVNTDTMATDTAVRHGQDTTAMVIPETQNRPVKQKTWVFMLFLFMLIVIGFTKSINIKKHMDTVSEAFRLRTSSLTFDDHAKEITLQNILYLFFQSLVIAYVFYSIYNYEGAITFHSGIQAFLFTLVVVISVYVVKYFIYRIVTLILDMRDMMPVILSTQSAIGYIFSLIALPLLAVAYYIKSEAHTTLLFQIVGVIGIVYVAFRFFKVVQLVSGSVYFPRIYLFLYLCTLEIVPLLVVINWLGLGWI